MKPVTAASSANERQRLLKLYQRHHRLPPGSTAELVQWAESDEGREALRAADKAKTAKENDR